jgi:hypothetical protein
MLTTSSAMIQKVHVSNLVKDASAYLNEKRGEDRYPYFCPVTIDILELREISFEGFCKDISLIGMGVICTAPMPDTKVRLSLADKFGNPMSVLGKVVRTEYCGKGWYSTGIEFCD